MNTLTLLLAVAALYRILPWTEVVLVLLGWYLNEQSALLMIPKVLINWLVLEGTLGEGHYTQQVVAGQEETEEKTVVEEHPGGEAVYVEEVDTEEGVEQAQKLELLVVMGLEFSVIFRCGVVHGLYFWRNKNSKMLFLQTKIT